MPSTHSRPWRVKREIRNLKFKIWNFEFEVPGTSNVEFRPSSLLTDAFLIPHFSFRICQPRTQNSELLCSSRSSRPSRPSRASLEKIDHNAQMHSMILNCVPDARHVVQFLPPIDFEAGLVIRQDIPPETDAQASKRVREGADGGSY